MTPGASWEVTGLTYSLLRCSSVSAAALPVKVLRTAKALRTRSSHIMGRLPQQSDLRQAALATSANTGSGAGVPPRNEETAPTPKAEAPRPEGDIPTKPSLPEIIGQLEQLSNKDKAAVQQQMPADMLGKPGVRRALRPDLDCAWQKDSTHALLAGSAGWVSPYEITCDHCGIVKPKTAYHKFMQASCREPGQNRVCSGCEDNLPPVGATRLGQALQELLVHAASQVGRGPQVQAVLGCCCSSPYPGESSQEQVEGLRQKMGQTATQGSWVAG